MNSVALAKWASRNGFVTLDERRYSRDRDDRSLRIEIKKLSVVIITERQGHRPTVTSKLFKDLRYDPLGETIPVLDAFAFHPVLETK